MIDSWTSALADGLIDQRGNAALVRALELALEAAGEDRLLALQVIDAALLIARRDASQTS